MLDKFGNLFKAEIGRIIKLIEDARPVYYQARSVPYALKELADQEIDRLEKLDIIENVTHSSWRSPVVPIVKSNGKLRLCADYKATVNKFLVNDNYAIPKIQDFFTKMNGGRWFCTLDIN